MALSLKRRTRLGPNQIEPPIGELDPQAISAARPRPSRRECLTTLAAAPFLALGFDSSRDRLAQGILRWRTTGRDVPQLVSFDQAMQQFMQDRNIPGGALAVTRNGQLVLARGYSWSLDRRVTIEPTSLFRIASLSKPIT